MNFQTLQSLSIPEGNVQNISVNGQVLWSSGQTCTYRQLVKRTIHGAYYNSELTNVGQYAFYGCQELTAVDFPNVTSISTHAFYNCTSLTTLTLPLVTSIGSSAFWNNRGLISVHLPSVTQLNVDAFRQCINLVSVSCPLIKGVASMAFEACFSLSIVDFPALQYIGDYAFRGSGLTTVNFPLVYSVGSEAFRGCNKLVTANLPLATDFGNSAFKDCKSLTTVKIPSISRITSYYLFSSCPNLTAVILSYNAVCTLSNATIFASTPIASGTGYIYVPADLVDSYKSATNWSTYADQFRAIEDYPEICGEGEI